MALRSRTKQSIDASEAHHRYDIRRHIAGQHVPPQSYVFIAEPDERVQTGEVAEAQLGEVQHDRGHSLLIMQEQFLCEEKLRRRNV